MNISKLISFEKEYAKYYKDAIKPVHDVIFIHSEAGQNPIQVDLPKPMDLSNLRLNAYVFAGVPSTAGIPNIAFYNVILSGHASLGVKWSRSDGQPGIALPLTGTYTHQVLTPGLLLNTEPGIVSRFTITIQNPDQTLATWNAMAMWMENYNPHPPLLASTQTTVPFHA